MKRLDIWLYFFEALSGLMRAYLTPAYPKGQHQHHVSRMREIKASEVLGAVARLATWGGPWPPVTVEVSAVMEDGVRWGFDVHDVEGEERWPTQVAPLRHKGLMRPGQIADLIVWQTGEVTTQGGRPVDEATCFEVFQSPRGVARLRLAWIGEFQAPFQAPFQCPQRDHDSISAAKQAQAVVVLEDLAAARAWIASHHKAEEGGGH